MSLSLVAYDISKPENYVYTFNNVKQQVSQLPLNRQMNGVGGGGGGKAFISIHIKNLIKVTFK